MDTRTEALQQDWADVEATPVAALEEEEAVNQEHQAEQNLVRRILKVKGTGHQIQLHTMRSLLALGPSEFLQACCGTEDLDLTPLGTDGRGFQGYYDPREKGYRFGMPVGEIFVKPATEVHGIPTDGTAQLEIRFAKDAYESLEQVQRATENSILDLFETKELQVTETYRTTSGSIVVKLRTTDVNAVEVAVALLRGHLRLNNLDYLHLGQHHPMTTELGELIRSATVEARMIPPECTLEEFVLLISQLQSEGGPIFTEDAPLEMIRARVKQQANGTSTVKTTITSQYATTLLDRKQIVTSSGNVVTLVKVTEVGGRDHEAYMIRYNLKDSRNLDIGKDVQLARAAQAAAEQVLGFSITDMHTNPSNTYTFVKAYRDQAAERLTRTGREVPDSPSYFTFKYKGKNHTMTISLTYQSYKNLTGQQTPQPTTQTAARGRSALTYARVARSNLPRDQHVPNALAAAQHSNVQAQEMVAREMNKIVPTIRDRIITDEVLEDGRGTKISLFHAMRNIQQHQQQDAARTADIMARLRDQTSLQEKIREAQAAQTKQLIMIGQQTTKTLQRTLDQYEADKAAQGNATDHCHHAGGYIVRNQQSDTSQAREPGMVGCPSWCTGPNVDWLLLGSVRGANVYTGRIIPILTCPTTYIAILMHECFNHLLLVMITLHLRYTHSAYTKDLIVDATSDSFGTFCRRIYHKTRTFAYATRITHARCNVLQLLDYVMQQKLTTTCNVLNFGRMMCTPPCYGGAGTRALDVDAMCDNFTLFDVYQSEAHRTAHPSLFFHQTTGTGKILQAPPNGE